MRNQRKRDLEMAVKILMAKNGKIVKFGSQTLARFSGKDASLRAGIYRRTLIDSIWKLFADAGR